MTRELRRWDNERHEYLPFAVPDDRRVTVRASDMDAVVDCASCGTTMTFGESMTSLEIHTVFGIGYAVCEGCYEHELRRRLSRPSRSSDI